MFHAYEGTATDFLRKLYGFLISIITVLLQEFRLTYFKNDRKYGEKIITQSSLILFLNSVPNPDS